MKRSMKKVLATVLAVASMFSMNMVTANAATNSAADTAWTAPCDKVRVKENSTSIYVKTSPASAVYVNVFGRTEYEGANQDVNVFGGSTLVTTNLPIPSNSERLIKQFIYELHYTYAFVHFWKSPPGGATAYGVWSPDSVGSFPSVN